MNCNRHLAELLRKADKAREDSWDDIKRKYTKSYADCYTEAGLDLDDPLRIILACLFTAGYCDMWEFCDTVLGKE